MAQIVLMLLCFGLAGVIEALIYRRRPPSV